MLSTVGGRGFPTIAVMSPEGELIGKHNGARSVEGFSATIDAAAGLVMARKKAAEGDEAAKTDVFMYELDFGLAGDYETANKRFSELKTVSDEQKVKIMGSLAGLEFDAIMAMREDLGEEGVGLKAYEMYKAGRIPTGNSEVDFLFYGVLSHARATKDAKLATEVADRLAKTEPFKDPRNAKVLEDIREEIAGFGK